MDFNLDETIATIKKQKANHFNVLEKQDVS